MKRTLSIITIITLLFAFIVIPVNAEETLNYDLKQAIEIAKEKLELNTEGYEFHSNYSENYGEGRKVWDLYWYEKEGNGESISVGVDATSGEILRYDNWMPSTSSFRKLPKYTKEEALKAAEEYINKICPEKFAEVTLYNNNYSSYYSAYSEYYNFTYVRQVNDIDFNNNIINVGIDKNTLKLRNFSTSWDNVTFPDIEGAMDKDAAKKLFIEKQGLGLTYQLVYPDSNKGPVAILAYTLKSNTPIDAFTGEILNNSYYSPPYYSYNYSMGESELKYSSSITPYEQKEIDDNSKYISKEQAVNSVKEYLPEIDNLILSHAALSAGNRNEDAIWYLSWNKNDVETGSYFSISASVDAITGELKNFYKDSNDIYNTEGKEVKYTEEQAKEIAVEFLQKIQPDKYKMTEYQKTDYSMAPSEFIPPVYNYNFVRKENGIDCYFNSLYVNVSAFTGEIINYSYWWADVELPSADNIISLDKAYESMFEKSDIELKYIKQYDYSKGIEASNVKLAYIIDNFSGMIDANSGALIGYDGKPYKEDTGVTEFNDIAGHVAEENINLLIEIGVIQTEASEFQPDSETLQKDFIKMLVKAMEPYSYYPIYDDSNSTDEYDYYYRTAIQKKLITEREKNPDGFVNRQEASKMFVRALGYGYIAEKSNLFIMPFEDSKYVLKSYKGYIILAEELGIFEAKDNKFSPKTLLSNGEAATSIVNFLKVDTNLDN